MVLRGFALVASLGVLVFSGGAEAAGSPAPSDSEKTERPSAKVSPYEEGLELIEAGDFVNARGAFERAVRRSPKDPDALNMLAYSQRKSGHLDLAIETYKKAIRLRGRFPQAREYLAEAYLQASLRELATLRSYGDSGAREAALLVTALKEAANELPPAEQVGTKRSW